MQSTSPTGLTIRIRKLPPKKRLIKLIGRITFALMTQAAGLLRPWSVRGLGNALGSAFYVCSKRYRTVALKNLARVFGNEKNRAEIEAIAKNVFRHFTRSAFEFFYLLALSQKQIDEMVNIQGKEHLDNALAKGNGCIIITGHYGNWELMARKLVILGYKINVIARDSDDPGMTGITTRIREQGGYRVFDRDQPIIGAFRALKNNEILGILPDQNDSSGIFVDFFGIPVATAVGPATLSLRSGAPLVPIFCARAEDGRYCATVYPKIEFQPSGNNEKDIHDLTGLINKAIEREVRRNPSQWLWIHDRWKLSPNKEENIGI
ncbi:MAG: lysophospholipid acyltransferase family protein [Armatimonadota bacterium]|nr:lysophospholipid acyltransferase family protein [bacterium]